MAHRRAREPRKVIRRASSKPASTSCCVRNCSPAKEGARMAKSIEHVHWPDASDLWMPYAPAIKVKGGTTVYLAGVTAAPVYHHHPHRPEEFDSMPRTMEGQARAALENLKRGLEGGGAS